MLHKNGGRADYIELNETCRNYNTFISISRDPQNTANNTFDLTTKIVLISSGIQ